MPHDPPAQGADAYPAADFRVASGVQPGDPVGDGAACVPGDIYRLRKGAGPRRLALRISADPTAPQLAGEGTDIGAPGDAFEFLSLLTFLRDGGDRLELLLIRHVASGGDFIIPLSPIAAGADFTFIAADTPPPGLRIADTICMAFAAGTMIALPGAAPVPVERLGPGDAILTRDRGAQPLRWVGKVTLRADGNFAPVVVTAGTMGNPGDLAVSPHHRLFLYARSGGPPAALIEARHLVDGDRITRRPAAWIDYYSLVFNQHEIIYAEGIPVESLRVGADILTRLPAEIADDLRARFPGLEQSPHAAVQGG